MRLPGRQQYVLTIKTGQCTQNLLQVVGSDVFITYHQYLFSRDVSLVKRGVSEHVARNVNGIAAFAQIDSECGHRLFLVFAFEGSLFGVKFFYLSTDLVHHSLMALIAGADAHMRERSINRAALFADFKQRCTCIALLQQRPVIIARSPLHLYVDIDVEKNNNTATFQSLTIFFSQYCPAAGGKDYVRFGSEKIYHALFAAAKSRFTFEVKNGGNIHPACRFNFSVAVIKGAGQAASELSAHSGLTSAHRAYKKNARHILT